jgi:chromosomal replication initiation ATPase DnaA
MQKKIIGKLENLALYEQAIIDLQIRVGELETALLQAKKLQVAILNFTDSDLAMELKKMGAKIINVPVEEIAGTSKYASLALMRQCIAYILHTKYKYSYQHIGKVLNRHHSTIIHSVRRFRDLLFTKDDLAVSYFKGLSIE